MPAIESSQALSNAKSLIKRPEKNANNHIRSQKSKPEFKEIFKPTNEINSAYSDNSQDQYQRNNKSSNSSPQM
ncbi:hypothetical protein [Spiroplasma endosymbiont of Nebria brevicollis]|uniref:hypothetical protein n=1 Tax=Spiroplasma endosymbiont of Nebria brevicollis TaxID=3066284 RepID=UPI00313C926B